MSGARWTSGDLARLGMNKARKAKDMSQKEFKAYIERKYSKPAKERQAEESESEIQTKCVAWFRAEYPKFRRLLFSIPNGVKLHGTEKERIITWKRLEREGAVPGAPDLFLSVPSGDLAGLYIEMKTPKGTQQDTQKEFEADAIEAGYGYVMPRSEKQFRQVVRRYFETGKYE